MTSILNIQKKIDPKLTANHWQLYSDMKGAKGAAHKLNIALKKAVNAKDSDPKSVTLAMQPVFESLADFGATDTAVREEFGYVLTKIYGYAY